MVIAEIVIEGQPAIVVEGTAPNRYVLRQRKDHAPVSTSPMSRVGVLHFLAGLRDAFEADPKRATFVITSRVAGN